MTTFIGECLLLICRADGTHESILFIKIAPHTIYTVPVPIHFIFAPDFARVNVGSSRRLFSRQRQNLWLFIIECSDCQARESGYLPAGYFADYHREAAA